MEEDFDSKPKSRRLYQLYAGLCISGILIGACSGLLYFGTVRTKDVAARLTTSGQMKQLSLAVHNHHDATDATFSPFLAGEAANNDVPERPSDRLSWRVAVLPYIDGGNLYRQFNRSEAWNSPTNRPVAATYYRPFADYLDGQTTRTPYRVFYDNGALWDSDPKRRIALDKIPDGAANTVLIAESTVQVPWAQFNEHPYSPDGPLPELGRATRNSFFLAMADGSVRAVKKSVAPHILRSAVTRDGGEQMPADW